jgi:hypothetical protein
MEQVSVIQESLENGIEQESNKFGVISSKWSDGIEKILKELGDSCQGYKWMNIFAAKRSARIYNGLMYTVIVIGPLSGILTTMSDDKPYLNVFVTVLSFLSGALSAISKFSRLERKSALHKSIAAKYASLEGNIRRQLSLSKGERVHAGDYLDWVSTSYDDLFSSTPLIPGDIYKKWVDFATQNNLALPKEIAVKMDVDKDKLKMLCTADTIKIHGATDSPNDQSSVTIEIPEEDAKEVFSDLGRYDEGKMKYEMSRLARSI